MYKKRTCYTSKSLRALSLAEAIISLFLLAFVAVGSMTQIGYSVQHKNDRVIQAVQLSQNVVSKIRAWALDPNNYQRNWTDWTKWDGKQEYDAVKFPGFYLTVVAKNNEGSLDSPCTELESQYDDVSVGGKRTLPKSIVPVHLTIHWGAGANQRFKLTTYIGEPVRSIKVGPYRGTASTSSLTAVNQAVTCSASLDDTSGSPMENLMYRWRSDSPIVALSPDSQRDGRKAKFTLVPAPPYAGAPPFHSPANLSAYTSYRGVSYRIEPLEVSTP